MVRLPNEKNFGNNNLVFALSVLPDGTPKKIPAELQLPLFKDVQVPDEFLAEGRMPWRKVHKQWIPAIGEFSWRTLHRAYREREALRELEKRKG